MDWNDINDKLTERAEEVCRHLFPNGKREGAEFVVGSLEGEAGHSLKVNLTGKVGVWKDFAGDRGGKNLMTLWLHARNLAKFGLAVVEAKQWLGIADDFQKRVRAYPDPADGHVRPTAEDSAWKAVAEVWAKCQPLTPEGPVWHYLVQTRGLDPGVLEAFQVREMISHGKWVMVFPYFATPGEADQQVRPTGLAGPATPEWLKFEALERVNGKKKEWTTKGPEKSLYGVELAQHALFKKCRHVILCEGEKDAMAWASYGCAVWGLLPVSVPFGAKWKGQDKGRPSPNREWLDRSWDWLQEFETVFVCMDPDEAGQRAARDIIAEIGPRRCRLVSMPGKASQQGHPTEPYKDPNECLQGGVPAEVMKACLDTATDFAPEKVKSAASLEKDFLKWVFEREEDEGIQLPFDFPLRLRRKEATLWMGVKGSGKSTLLNFITTAAMAQGERALVASFEMPWENTNDTLCRQAFGGFYFDKRILKKCQNETERTNYLSQALDQTVDTHRWLAKNLWYYTHVGIAHWRQLGDDMRWARRRLGITFFGVDNFMRLGISKDDYAQQADCMIFFAGLAMELDAHIVVVIHQDKDSGKAKNRNKISGSAASASGAHEIGDNAANVVEIQRDDAKGKMMSELFEERKVSESIGTFKLDEFTAKKAALDLKPDGKFILHNQRNGDVQDGSKHLWFDWQSKQYFDCPQGHANHIPIRFVANAHLLPKAQELPTDGWDDVIKGS